MAAGREVALLVARAQLGDRGALDALLARIQQPLFLHARQLVGDDDLAADVLQEALLAISRRLGSLRDPRWFRAWAYRIATRQAVRAAQRSRRALAAISSDDPDLLPAAEVESRFEPELVAQVPAMLASLPPASALVLRMHYMDELTLTEIAEALELSPGTVKSRLAYGLAALRGRTGVAPPTVAAAGPRAANPHHGAARP